MIAIKELKDRKNYFVITVTIDGQRFSSIKERSEVREIIGTLDNAISI